MTPDSTLILSRTEIQAAPARRRHPGRRPRRPHVNLPLLAGLAVAIALNDAVIRGVEVPFARPAAGFWWLIVAPSWLLFTAQIWPRGTLTERLGYSAAGTIFLLMTAGLAVNTVAPLAGFRRPLDTLPVLILGDALNVALYAVRWRSHRRRRRRAAAEIAAWRRAAAAITRAELRLLVLGAVAVTLAVMGASRLNNGSGDALTMAALVAVTLALALLLAWRSRVRDLATAGVVYLLSLTLLLSTSLRGWSVTGHDIQQEYRVFQLTAVHGRWDMAYYRDAYNACLSITLLPTELLRLTGVDAPYVFKVFNQLLFALVPVLVYAIARRYASPFIAVLAVAYFIGFPTFFTDMPFLNRQETAYLFVAVATLVITSPALNSRHRQAGLVLAGTGVELSHYSTMYVFLVTLGLTLLARYAGTALGIVRHPRTLRTALMAGTACTVTIGVVALLAGVTFAWGDLATRTSGQAVSVASSLTDKNQSTGIASGGGARSQDTSLSLLGGQAPTESQVLDDYRASILAVRAAAGRAGAPAGFFLPLSAAGAATPAVAPAVRPLTGIGQTLQKAGVPVDAVDAGLRDLTADAEQVFLVAALIWLLFTGRHRTRPELFWLCAGNVAMVALLTVLPSLSADYGVLRAFAEALMVIAPVVVAGSVVVLSPLGPRRAQLAAAVVGLGLFVTTTGLLPQLLGGNAAELNLNNSGNYYDVYYTHPQELAAVAWLGRQKDGSQGDIQASFDQYKYIFTSPGLVNGSEVITDIYPAGVMSQSWLIVGYSMLRTGMAYTIYDGDLLEYRYPWSLLDEHKDLVYDNGGSEIYK